MERDNYNKYNLLIDDENETIIGFYRNIIDYYKNVAKDYIDKGIYNESKLTIDLLDLLGQAVDNEFIKETDLLGIYYDEFMNKYLYKKYVEKVVI